MSIDKNVEPPRDIFGLLAGAGNKVRNFSVEPTMFGSHGPGHLNTPFNAVGSFVSNYGSVGPSLFRLVEGALPLGLTINPQTGVPIGTPRELGVFNYVLEQSDGLNRTVAQPMTISILGTLQIESWYAPEAMDGTEYSSTPVVSGGYPPYTYTLIDEEEYRYGLELDEETGTLSGSISEGITIGSSETSSIGILVTDSQDNTATQAHTFTLFSSFGVLSYAQPDSLDLGDTVEEASVTFAGGRTPYSHYFSELPHGVTPVIVEDGGTFTIDYSGWTPAEAGTYHLRSSVTDAVGTTIHHDLEVEIVANRMTLQNSAASYEAGEYFEYDCTVSGGIGPYTWSIGEAESNYALPYGTELATYGDNNEFARISGRCVIGGTYPLALTVEDSNGQQDSNEAGITITVPGQDLAQQFIDADISFNSSTGWTAGSQWTIDSGAASFQQVPEEPASYLSCEFTEPLEAGMHVFQFQMNVYNGGGPGLMMNVVGSDADYTMPASGGVYYGAYLAAGGETGIRFWLDSPTEDMQGFLGYLYFYKASPGDGL